MYYSVIDVESEISELIRLIRRYESFSADVICWRLEQMLEEAPTGSKLRNIRILSAIYRIEMAIELIADSKNKKSLEIIIRNKKEEIETFESQTKSLTLRQFLKNKFINI